MPRLFVAVLLLFHTTLCFAADDSQELPLKYTLVLNGVAHEVQLNRPVQIQGTYTNPKAELKASSIRYFTYGEIAFHYPAGYTWEAKIKAPNEKTWTLSGNDFKIMYFITPEALPVETFAKAMATQFGKGTTRISDTERTLGAHKHKGKLLFVKLAGVSLNIEVYALPANAGSRLLVLQDSPPDNKVISDEAEKTLDMLSKSFKISVKGG